MGQRVLNGLADGRCQDSPQSSIIRSSADRPRAGPCDVRLGRAGDDGRQDLSPIDLRLRLCVDVGRAGSDLTAARSILASNNPCGRSTAGSAPGRVDPEQGLVTLPSRVGVWRQQWACSDSVGSRWYSGPDHTPVLRLWALAWLVLVLGAIVFGQRWIGAADPFEAYASTLAQMSIWRRVGDQLRLVNPLAGLNAWHAPPGATAVVAALLGSTAFDSLTNTSWWIRAVQSSTVPTVVWATGGLLIMIIIVFVTFSLAAAWMGRYGNRPAAEYPRLMVGSLLPIVLGYVVAHYATLLIVEGQRTAINFSDPLGRG